MYETIICIYTYIHTYTYISLIDQQKHKIEIEFIIILLYWDACIKDPELDS